MRAEAVKRFLTVFVLGAITLFLLSLLHPSLIFRNNTPTGGDMGAHVWGPAYLRDHLLPNFRLTGWSMDWYGGFPIYQFYMVVPALFIVFLNIVLPYGIAFKLVAIAGIISLPFCAWGFGRLARLAFPMPELMAIAATIFLLDESFTIYGGNIASTMAGEYSFSIALSFAIIGFGVFTRGMETGKHRGLAAFLISMSALSHGIVLLFVFGGVALMALMYFERQRIRYSLTTIGVAILLAGFWVFPFLSGHEFMTDMKYEPKPSGFNDSFWKMFFPLPIQFDWLIMVLAMIGFAAAVIRRQTIIAWMGIFALMISAGVFLAQQPLPLLGMLWNPRLLPFIFLLRYMLMMAGLVEVARLILSATRKVNVPSLTGAVANTCLIIAGLGTFVVYGFRFQELPGGKLVSAADGLKYSWLGIKVPAADGFVDGWARWNFEGYEGKDSYAEYQAVIDTMDQLGKNPEFGCGRALWENNNGLNKYGTTMSMMLLPHWTDGCIGSMEGLFFESAGSTPYHFITAAAMSKQSSNPVRELRYENLDMEIGVPYMRAMGIKYYMAFTEEGKQAASTAKGITKIAESGPWVIYEVQDSEIISPLSVEPVVVNERTGDSRERWLELGTSYFQNGDEWPVMPVASGPDSWQRMDVKVDTSRVVGVAGRSGHQVDVVVPATEVEQRTIDPVTVSNVDIDQDTIRFRVDRVGEPVLIRVSYFPNWEVKGADAVYRAAPNYMVVVPTESQVVLTYGTSGIEYLGILMTLAGIGILILWWRRGSRIHYGVGLYGPSSGASDLTENSNVEALDVIVKAYDIRGLVPSQFNAQIANALGIAFAKFTDSETVLIARDMRTSGDLLCRAFADGVRRQGVNVIDLGLASTDLLYFAAGTLNAPGAMFTASHNPGEYNGIKMCLAGAKPIGADTGLAEIKAIAAKVLVGQAPRASEREGTIESRDMVEDFANHVVSFLGGTDLGTMRVVADTANGMGGLVVPEVFRLIPGVALEVMYPELDGTFPNHPADPIQPENQKDLRARVVAGGFDVGLAFDGDADRVFVVDEKGEGLSGSTTTAILAAAVLRDNPGATILHNLICSRAVSEVIREHGGVPVRTKVGHSYIKQVMADTGAVFGGEHSAHYYFLDNFRADSGLIASMIVLAEIARSGKPLSELRKPFDRYAASGEINTSVNDPLAVIELVAEEFAEFPQDRLDGLTVDCGEWWFNLRPSNTEPLLRLNLEAADRSSCDMHVSRLLSLITGG